MEYKIYNLIFNRDNFDILGYNFTKDINYNSKINNLYKPMRINNSGQITQDEQKGNHEFTFHAKWKEEQKEGSSRLSPDSKLIDDICNLFSFFGSQLVGSEDNIIFNNNVFENHLGNGFTSEEDLIKNIENIINSESPLFIDSQKYCEELNKAFFMLIVWKNNSGLFEIQQLLLSPVIDIISNYFFKEEIGDYFNKQSKQCFSKIKNIINDEIEKIKIIINDDNSSNTEQKERFIKRIDYSLKNFETSFYQGSAFEKLEFFLKSFFMELDLNIPEENIALHAKIFNEFRNKIVHTIKSNDKLNLETIVNKKYSKDDRKRIIQCLAHYTSIYFDISYLFLTFKLGLHKAAIVDRIKKNIESFFNDGKYNGIPVLENSVKEYFGLE